MKTKLIISVIALFTAIFISAGISYSNEKDNCCCAAGKCAMESCCTSNGCNMECCKDCGDMSCCKNDCCSNGKSSGTMKMMIMNKMSDSNSTTTKTSTAIIDPVSKKEIASGEGVDFKYLGTSYKFESKDNLEKFKAEPMDYLDKRTFVCPVIGEPAVKDISLMVDGVKYYFCCDPCSKKFKKNPDKYKDGYKDKE
jgi:YHS domain-containing protein